MTCALIVCGQLGEMTDPHLPAFTCKPACTGGHRRGHLLSMQALKGVTVYCRWNASMEQGAFRQEHWRKSAQWSALVRKHAQVVADDVQIADLFSKDLPRRHRREERHRVQMRLRRGEGHF